MVKSWEGNRKLRYHGTQEKRHRERVGSEDNTKKNVKQKKEKRIKNEQDRGRKKYKGRMR